MKIIVQDKAVELSDEQLEMYGNLTKLQKSVSLKKLEGLSDAEAYRQGGGKAKGASSLTSAASEILTNLDVRQFIDSFNGHLISRAIMSREEMLERLTVMARTEITDVIKFSDAAPMDTEADGQTVIDEQSVWSLRQAEDMRNGGTAAISELTASRDGLKIKLHDQKAAMKQIADIEGFNAAIRLAHGGDPDAPPIQAITRTVIDTKPDES